MNINMNKLDHAGGVRGYRETPVYAVIFRFCLLCVPSSLDAAGKMVARCRMLGTW